MTNEAHDRSLKKSQQTTSEQQQPQEDDARLTASRNVPHSTLWSIRTHSGDIDICDVVTGTILQTIRQAKAGVHPTIQEDDARLTASRNVPHSTLWSIRTHSGDIDICDVVTGTILQTIRQAKAGVHPTTLRHVPYCSVYASDVSGTIFYGSPLARKTAFDQQLLHLKDERRVKTDFVWVGFVDGTIRLVQARGNSAEMVSRQRVRKEESDYFNVIHELPKCHSAEVVAFEMSPFHPTRAQPAKDDVSNPPSFEDAKQRMIANDLLPADRYGQYLCSASADSCVVVWDLADVYREIELLSARQLRLEAEYRHGTHLGAKGPRVTHQHVTGLKRSGDPIYIDNLQFGETDPSTLVTFATFVTSAKPLLRLKGTVCGLKHLRWTASVVTTKGHQRPRHVVATTRDIGDVEEQDGRRQLKLHQTQTRQDERDERMRLLGLTEDEMQDAEHEMALRLPKFIEEPVCSKTVHFLVAGDSNGYVMIWNLAEELSRKTEPPRPAAASHGNGLSKRMLDSQGRSPTRGSRNLDADVRSLATHVTTNAAYLRSTDQRIQFSGGVSISGLEPLLPQEIRITMRRAEPANVAMMNNMSAFDDTLGTPRATRSGGELDLVNEFLPLTDEVALYHAYKHLEIFVAVDGSVQFLSCHPAQLTRESEEQLYRLYRLLDQNASPNRIEARRGLDDEVVGSLDFQTFSVFFSKRVLQYHTQPITSMRLDILRKELWVARYDGMVSIFSTTKLKELCRIPHPHAYETYPPHSAHEVEEGLAEYHYLAGMPLHLEEHPESAVFVAKSFVRDFAATSSDVCERILCAFGPEHHDVNEVVHVTALPHDTYNAITQTETYMTDRLKKIWAMREKRLAERDAAKQAATHRQRIQKRVDRALSRIMNQESILSTQGTVLAMWLQWAKQRKSDRVASHTAKFVEREQDCSLKWSDFVQQARAAVEENRELRQRVFHVIAETANNNLLRSYLVRWHESHLTKVSRRVEIPMLVGNNGMRVLRRFYAKWSDNVTQRHDTASLVRQNTRFHLIRQLQYGREVAHSAFLKWKRFSDTANRMNEWLSVHVDEHLITATGNGVNTAVQQRYFHKWTSGTFTNGLHPPPFAKSIDFSHQQRSQFRAPDGVVHTHAARRSAAHAAQRQSDHLKAVTSHYELEYDTLETQHYIAAAHLLCEAFDDASQVLEIEIAAGGGADEEGSGSLLLSETTHPLRSFDVLMNDTSGRTTDEEHRVLLWTAIENLRCENASMRKAHQQTAEATYLADREVMYLESSGSAAPKEEAGENGDSHARTEKTNISDMLESLRHIAATQLAKSRLSSILAISADRSVDAHSQLSLLFPRQNSISTLGADALKDIATRCVTQFLLPKLEELSVFTHSSDGAQTGVWESVMLALDALWSLEVDGDLGLAEDSSIAARPPSLEDLKESDQRPLEYLDLAVALDSENGGKLQKFVKTAQKVIQLHRQENTVS
ncbi:Hypothetical protein, putative [Bodo saltans]|uniref:Uncharacterized protein n=1 Tax=Bodo saltans TaxID=75058 RepID=A0A0S4IX28_BODSA|nr:Hypothetical protein, putative [Bodo saltans]|eukprot:CUG06211.1 Hypothetical protein, putative [Bodo saltans]